MRIAVELFVIGIVASIGPCVVWCSPVILPYIAATRKGWREGLVAVSVFLFGRLITYTFLGALAGLTGRYLALWFRQYADFFYAAGGAFIAFIGLLIIFNAGFSRGVCLRLNRQLVGERVKGPMLLGLVAGVLPCLPLLGVLAYIALNSQNLWQGAFFGAAFGAGKFISPLIPLGILAGALPAKLINKHRLSVFFRRLCGLILLLVGINLIAYRIWK